VTWSTAEKLAEAERGLRARVDKGINGIRAQVFKHADAARLLTTKVI